MSLDVYLNIPNAPKIECCSGIFIREDGQTKEISAIEWKQRFPDRSPVRVMAAKEESHQVYSANITHNLNRMAKAAGIYEHIWRPDEIGIDNAGELVTPLRDGFAKLISDPESYKKYNPENGWGTYEILVSFVNKYLQACMTYPTAKVHASR